MRFSRKIALLLTSFLLTGVAHGLMLTDLSDTILPDTACTKNCTFTSIPAQLVQDAQVAPAETNALELTSKYLTSANANETVACGGARSIVVKNILPSSSNTGTTYNLGQDFLSQCRGPVTVNVNSGAILSNASVTVKRLGAATVPPTSSPLIGTYCGTPGQVCPPPPPTPPPPPPPTCRRTQWCQGNTLYLCHGAGVIKTYPGQCRGGVVL